MLRPSSTELKPWKMSLPVAKQNWLSYVSVTVRFAASHCLNGVSFSCSCCTFGLCSFMDTARLRAHFVQSPSKSRSL